MVTSERERANTIYIYIYIYIYSLVSDFECYKRIVLLALLTQSDDAHQAFTHVCLDNGEEHVCWALVQPSTTCHVPMVTNNHLSTPHTDALSRIR